MRVLLFRSMCWFVAIMSLAWVLVGVARADTPYTKYYTDMGLGHQQTRETAMMNRLGETIGEVTQPSPKPRPPVGQGEKAINLYPVTALFSQNVVDQGNLVTWMTSPTCLIAGHNNRGWNWLDDIANGTAVNVKTGPCTGSYVVVGHRRQSVKGGPVPAWMSGYPLILQTCTSTGLGFSLLVKS